MEAEKNAKPKSRKRIGIKWKMFAILLIFVAPITMVNALKSALGM